MPRAETRRKRKADSNGYRRRTKKKKGSDMCRHRYRGVGDEPPLERQLTTHAPPVALHVEPKKKKRLILGICDTNTVSQYGIQI